LAAVICHPHPLFGGTLHNKVVPRWRARCAPAGPRGALLFRGVGASEGTHDEGVGETRTRWRWWRGPPRAAASLVLAGYLRQRGGDSGGQRIRPAWLITVAPAVDRVGSKA
jgi:alpha/beta superfamily hydrolase